MEEQLQPLEAGKQDAGQFLIFNVMNAEYAVDIMTVREIKCWTETTRLPNAPHFIRGVINLRGLIIPIFDLRARFTHDLTAADSKHVVVILAVGGRSIGLLVDSVSDILAVTPSEIKSAPAMETPRDEDYISGLISRDDRMVVVLSVTQLFGGFGLGENIPALDHKTAETMPVLQ